MLLLAHPQPFICFSISLHYRVHSQNVSNPTPHPSSTQTHNTYPSQTQSACAPNTSPSTAPTFTGKLPLLQKRRCFGWKALRGTCRIVIVMPVRVQESRLMKGERGVRGYNMGLAMENDANRILCWIRTG